MNIQKIFENNEKWVKKKLSLDPQYFETLAKGQNPKILYIGCSDSRVSTEELMGLEPGEVFVHRNIANMVVGTDLNVMSVLEYAVEKLEIEHIIVCGHYDCNGVKAAMMPEDLGILNPWLRNIRDVYRLHRVELNAIINTKQKYNRLIELNVQEQCINVLKTAVVQTAIHKRGITVHGWIFDVHTGKIIDLNIHSDELLKDIEKIYRLSE